MSGLQMTPVESKTERYVITPALSRESFWVLTDTKFDRVLATIQGEIPMAKQIIESISIHIQAEQAKLQRMITHCG